MRGRALNYAGTPQSKMGDRTGASERVAQAATDAAAHIGLECAPAPTAIAVTDAYVGTGFGFPDPETLSALRLLAGNEGILVDPTYTGKAFACLIDLVRKGRFGADEDIVFVHTGGTPLLFAYGEELLVGCGIKPSGPARSSSARASAGSSSSAITDARKAKPPRPAKSAICP